MHYSEFVLKRDGKDVKADSSCKVESGTWISPYDGTTWTDGSKLDIDHLVPLENAWIVSNPHFLFFFWHSLRHSPPWSNLLYKDSPG